MFVFLLFFFDFSIFRFGLGDVGKIYDRFSFVAGSVLIISNI